MPRVPGSLLPGACGATSPRVRKPTRSGVRNEHGDGLYAFTDQRQAEAYAALHDGAERVEIPLNGEIDGAQLVREADADEDAFASDKERDYWANIAGAANIPETSEGELT